MTINPPRPSRHLLRFVFFLTVLLLGSEFSHAQSSADDPLDGIPYQKLVDKLNQQSEQRSKAKIPVAQAAPDIMDEAKIHAGVAFANSVYNIQIPNGASLSMSQSGFEVALGMDLFSENWVGEVAFLNLGQASAQSMGQTIQIAANEFDLRFFYHTPLAKSWGYKIGSGLGSRNFHIEYPAHGLPGSEFTVPEFVFFGGPETFISDQISIGAEVGVRTALIQDTPERTSLDLLLRISGKF